jgi:hypothetical protein
MAARHRVAERLLRHRRIYGEGKRTWTSGPTRSPTPAAVTLIVPRSMTSGSPGGALKACQLNAKLLELDTALPR